MVPIMQPMNPNVDGSLWKKGRKNKKANTPILKGEK